MNDHDNWQHCSSLMRCQTCMWFVPKFLPGGAESELGRCRERSPTVKGWPAVFKSDWCGSHKLDQNKAERSKKFRHHYYAVGDPNAERSE